MSADPTPQPQTGRTETAKERYARAVAARKAREDQARAADHDAARARAAAEAADHAAQGEDQGWTPVLAPPDPDKPASRAMLAILGAMLLITGAIALLATLVS
ncbi:hypothetical protein [Yinghuangia seranimata]|uniref:hypothetical protein n=1 Tax=Yinghuangia seranimata TaxID=408067 RepID=UPI00248B8DA4|nr:hypothetical protein [Yinghuangia seranimata]MDI2126382.1 hypothetical protein [Yinghuangia seranimata]